MSESPSPVRALPRLAFEIRRTRVNPMTAAGLGAGYTSLEVSLLATGGAMELQRALGFDAFGALLTLAMSAQEADNGDLFVPSATSLLQSQAGWSRPKASKVMRDLIDGGFIEREQSHAVAPGRAKFGQTRSWLARDLYQWVDRRLTSTVTETRVAAPSSTRDTASRPVPQAAATLPDRTGDKSGDTTSTRGAKNRATTPKTGVKERDTTSPSGANFGSTTTASAGTSSVATERDTTRVRPGRTGGKSRATTKNEHLHADDDVDELHRRNAHDDEPPPHEPTAPQRTDDLDALRLGSGHLSAQGAAALALADVSAFTVEEVRTLGREEMITLFTSWGVRDAQALVVGTPAPVLSDVLVAMGSRWATIKNPGAYLRRLVREALSGSSPTPRLTTSGPASVATSARSAQPAEGDAPVVSAAAVSAALAELDAALRSELEDIADDVVARTPWVRGPSLSAALRSQTLARELLARGLLHVAPPTDSSADVA